MLNMLGDANLPNRYALHNLKYSSYLTFCRAPCDDTLSVR